MTIDNLKVFTNKPPVKEMDKLDQEVSDIMSGVIRNNDNKKTPKTPVGMDNIPPPPEFSPDMDKIIINKKIVPTTPLGGSPIPPPPKFSPDMDKIIIKNAPQTPPRNILPTAKSSSKQR